MFINTTGSLGVLFTYLTLNITGSEILSIISIFLMFIVIGLMFRMPTEIILILLIPLILVFMSFYSGFLLIGGLILIFLAIIFALNYFIK